MKAYIKSLMNTAVVSGLYLQGKDWFSINYSQGF
jgi:hypothetical protein